MNAARSFRRLLQLGLVVLLMTPGPAAAGPLPPGPTATTSVPTSYHSPLVNACGDAHSGAFTTTSTSMALVVTCTLVIGQSGHLVVLANGTVGLVNSGDAYEANFELSHNTGAVGDPNTDRYVDVYPDSALLPGGDGTDRNVAISAFYTVTAGVHTLALLVRRTEGNDSVEVANATLSVLFVPDGLDVKVCGQMGAVIYTTFLTTLSKTATCTLDIPRPGRVFVSADGWLSLEHAGSQPYEAFHRIVLDDNTAGSIGVRYTDVYTNTGDGVDTVVAASEVFNVSPGVHDFSLGFKLSSAVGTVKMSVPSLVAVYVPYDSPYANACSDRGTATWQNATTTYTTLATCNIRPPEDSWAFVSGTAGVSLPNLSDAYEAVFGLGLDSLAPSSSAIRYINSYPDADNGLDGSVPVSIVLPITGGGHTVNLLGRRYAGTGTVLARYPVLFVLVPGASIYLPLAFK